MKRIALLLLALLAPAGAGAATLTLSCGAVGQELALCREGAEDWAAETGHRVRVVSAPNATNERLALYQQLLAARSPDIDVLQVDVVWPGALAAHLLDLGEHGLRGAGHLPALVENNTVDGRLVAMPWFLSTGLLYYRRDLLEEHGARVPETWDRLTLTATRIQDAEREAGDDGMWGFVWQGRAYEGLTCNALEWVASHGGGTILDAAGRVTIDNPGARAALEQAAAWVDGISPPGVLNYTEEEARGVFQSGHAVFMRNWPYAWALAQGPDSPVRGRVGIAPLPAGEPGGPRATTLGGWQLAVSRYSEHPELAADLVAHLTGAGEQRRRAIAGAYNPTRPALYQDPEVLAANPFMADVRAALADAVARPSAAAGAGYNRLSSRFWNAVHGVLAGRTPAAPALKRLARTLERDRRRGRW